MKKVIVLCTFCALMSWPVAGHAQGYTNQSKVSTSKDVTNQSNDSKEASKKDSERLSSAKNFGETPQAKEVERQLEKRDYSTFNQKVENGVKDAVKNAQGKSDNNTSSDSSSNKDSNTKSGNNTSSGSSSNKDSSTKSSNNTSSGSNTSSSGNDASKCSTCTDKAKALKNAR